MGYEIGLWPGGSSGHIPAKPTTICLEEVDPTNMHFWWMKVQTGHMPFVQLNEALSHVPLSSEGYISVMMDGAPCVDACGWLHQLLICKLLQHNNMVVCSEGLNSELEALHFTLLEMPLWNDAAPRKPACKPQLIEVDLGSISLRAGHHHSASHHYTGSYPLSG